MTQKHDITFGDLVKVAGYAGRLFFVDGWTTTTYYEPDAEWSDILYDLTCAFSGEYEVAFAEDITRICGAEATDDYLKCHAHSTELNGKEVNGMMFGRKPEKQPTARELSAQEADRRKKARKEKAEKIDALLDEYGDYRRLADEFGDEEYRARVEYLGVKLAELSEEGRQ